jgi:hypothetical protein
MDGFGSTIWGTAPTWQVAVTGTATGALLGLSLVSGPAWIIWFPIAVGIGWAAWRTGRFRAAPWLLGGLGGLLVADALARGSALLAAGLAALALAVVVGAVQLARWKRTP